MAYEFIKANGRVSILKNGEFDHQQFKSHWAYRDPTRYLAQLEAWDRETAADRANARAIRVEDAKAYLAARAARLASTQLVMEF